MDTDQTQDAGTESGYENVPDISALDNFDLSTPAEAEARALEASQQDEEESEKEVKPEVKTEVEAETKEEVKPYQPPQKVQLQAKPFEATIPVDEYGNVDAEKLGEYLQSRDEHLREVARIEAQNANYEIMHGQREWNDVNEAYPELVKNETTRSLIENLRVADAIRGGEGNLMEAARQISELQSSKFEEGKQSQQSNITRQKSVTLKSSSRSQAPDTNNISTLRKKAFSGSGDSESARRNYISALYESGALDA